ncbi:NAD(P)-dependent oxidoreductase [Caballeronia sp. SEWSISQ10-4 2]|uniref:NAD(P)-dependent oxidoreductase n=1 Tax=Caballeronia sp. SEWSISQ10-4 2 TaxID=2937438 RepID=UPI00264C01BA|nr:NAD(P)-dependent oxidoreductase [Caballeronia sp. SEWSISQ10-4 2]MDN7177026.1 NAD(P)-dependent oxidoreductase [Caballeronia sp. SEWSISQ10-4 2]
MTSTTESAGPRAQDEVGFIGLGGMGQPMAMNLAKAGTKLVVWNRSAERAEPLRAIGVQVGESADEVFRRTETVIVMLSDSGAIDSVLGSGTPAFASRVAGHTIVSMSSVAPDYSRGLAASIHAAGGRYVEAPVSGSRKPAEAGQLVSLLGGDPETIAKIRPMLAPMCRATVICGPVGNALLMKLAVNLYANTMLVGLSEAMHFADRNGLDLNTFKAAIDSGPMACDVTRVKIPKLVERDFAVQAATADAFTSCQLIADAARAAGIASPLLDLSRKLYGESVDLGNGRLDMMSVIRSIEARTASVGWCCEEASCPAHKLVN